MHELRRLAYLNSLGIDAYLSRRQLPGAAPSRRLAVVRAPSDSANGVQRQAAETMASRPHPDTHGSAQKTIANSLLERPLPSRPPADDTVADRPAVAEQSARVRFSLSAIVAGRILWLESLGDMPLASEQVALVQAMALALERYTSAAQATAGQKPEMSRFDWPMHQNQQLDNSREAALAGLTAFMQRRIEQFQCRAVIMLGSDATRWAKGAALGVPIVHSLSTLQMLEDASTKVQVWRDLAPLRVSD